MKSLSHVRLLATPWTAAYQAPLSMGFSRHSLKEWPCSLNVAGVLVFKYWSEGPERSQVLWVVDSRICVLCVVCLCVSVCVCVCVLVCVFMCEPGEWTYSVFREGAKTCYWFLFKKQSNMSASCHCKATSSHHGGSPPGNPVAEFVLGLRGFSWHRAHVQESVRLTHSPVAQESCLKTALHSPDNRMGVN